MADKNQVKYEETVLITGGSGLTGRYITSALLGNGFRVVHLSTRNSSFGKVRVHRWSPGEGILDPAVLEDVDHIIHLAGANVGEKRWTRARKNEIMTSRTASARLIFETAIKEGFRFKSFISSSASGYYGTANTGKIFSEDDRPGDDFLAMVGRQWEAEADRFSSIASRVVKIRTSVVLDRSGGAFPKLVGPTRFGVFPVIGNGRQYMPWIHIDDLVAVYVKAVTDEKMNGAYNAAAPSYITQKEFMKLLSTIQGKPFFSPRVPAFLLRIMMGEGSSMVLEGNRLSPARLSSAGFTFSYPDAEKAIRNLLGQA